MPNPAYYPHDKTITIASRKEIEGDETVSKYAYAVFYKDGKVVSVQCEYAHDTLEGLVLFETGKIDFDYFKIFY